MRCIEFSKRRGLYDFHAPLINFTGNSAVVCAGSALATVVTNCAFKALDLEGIIPTIVKITPVILTTISAVAVFQGFFWLWYVDGIEHPSWIRDRR